jgi:uncharacterized protein with HEPN domain
MLRDDNVYLADMLCYARYIVQYTANVDQEMYAGRVDVQLIVERCIIAIGEAANRTAVEFRSARPEIPWQQIIGMRHVLTHDYDNIRLDTVWDVMSNRVPSLIEAILAYLPPEQGAAPPENTESV